MNYKTFAKKNIFKTDEFYQFNLLFNDIDKINKMNFKHIAILERSHIYNGFSIFSPLIRSKSVSIIDYQFSKMIKKRIGYQYKWIEKLEYKFLKSEFLIKDDLKKFIFNFKKIDCDLLIIPNVLHHCSDFKLLLKYLLKKMPYIKYIYIFDSYLREGHQHPFDYARHTPSSIEKIFSDLNIRTFKINKIGNAFDVLLYFISQSKVLLDNNENKNLKNKFNEIIPLLKSKRKSKKWEDLGRKYASLNSAYSIFGKK